MLLRLPTTVALLLCAALTTHAMDLPQVTVLDQGHQSQQQQDKLDENVLAFEDALPQREPLKNILHPTGPLAKFLASKPQEERAEIQKEITRHVKEYSALQYQVDSAKEAVRPSVSSKMLLASRVPTYPTEYAGWKHKGGDCNSVKEREQAIIKVLRYYLMLASQNARKAMSMSTWTAALTQQKQMVILVAVEQFRFLYDTLKRYVGKNIDFRQQIMPDVYTNIATNIGKYQLSKLKLQTDIQMRTLRMALLKVERAIEKKQLQPSPVDHPLVEGLAKFEVLIEGELANLLAGASGSDGYAALRARFCNKAESPTYGQRVRNGFAAIPAMFTRKKGSMPEVDMSGNVQSDGSESSSSGNPSASKSRNPFSGMGKAFTGWVDRMKAPHTPPSSNTE